ncbi:hypothetical protein GW17_00059856 [Ensete ventricosum]|nr:hypothetical protein GW17_00059856 [Ensete ventricosum]
MARQRPRPTRKERPPVGLAARKGAGCCAAPASGDRQRPALSPTGAATPAAGVAAPWQGGYRPQRAVAACVGVTVATSYGSVEVTAGPTTPWREITPHGDAMAGDHAAW